MVTQNRTMSSLTSASSIDSSVQMRTVDVAGILVRSRLKESSYASLFRDQFTINDGQSRFGADRSVLSIRVRSRSPPNRRHCS